MYSRLSYFYSTFILGRPVATLVVLLLAFLFLAFHASDFRLDASADSLLLEDDEDLRIFRELVRRYETREFLFVTFTPEGDLFSDGSLAKTRRLRDELAGLEFVDSVISIVDVPLVKQKEGSLADVARNYRTLESDDADRELARRELLESPIYRNLVLSEDGRTTALQINLRDNPRYKELQVKRRDLLSRKKEGLLTAEEKKELGNTLEEYDVEKTHLDRLNHETIVRIREIMDGYRGFGTLHLGGVPMIADDMITFIKNDLIVFGFGVFVFLVGMLSIIFRSVRWVILPLTSCIYAGLLMIGLLGLIGWRVTVISSNFISLMLIITMAMNIHLIVRYRQLRRDFPGKNQKELVLETARKMVWPCLYTALTTIMAFSSLVVSDIKPVIDFGWMMTIGLTVTFFTSFLLFPSLLVLFDKGDVQVAPGGERSGFTAYLAKFTERHGNKVLLVSLLLALVSGYGITRLEVENSFINYFKKDTEIARGLALIDERLGGTTPLDILIRFEGEPEPAEENDEFAALFGDVAATGDAADYWFTPDKVEQVKEVHDYLEGLHAVGKVLSLASIIRVGEDINKGEFDAFELAIVYKRMPEELKDTMIDPYISIENNEARINLRVKDSLKDLRRKEFLQTIRQDLTGKLGLSEDEFQLTGLLVLYNNMLQSLFKSQILTLGVVMTGIAFMLLVLFRSASLAVIGIIPNLLASATILGLMGLLAIPLDMMTITIASITIGIAVDNSIHYIYRYREEFPRNGNNYVETMHYCHANIGNAVYYTAITIIVGFSILVFSNFIPTIYFGVLTALAMLIALLAALTLLPKLLLIWRPF